MLLYDNLNYERDAELMVAMELNLLEMQQNGKERSFIWAIASSITETQRYAMEVWLVLKRAAQEARNWLVKMLTNLKSFAESYIFVPAFVGFLPYIDTHTNILNSCFSCSAPPHPHPPHIHVWIRKFAYQYGYFSTKASRVLVMP